MKKLLIVAALLFVANFAIAQDAFKADVLKVIQKSGAAAPMQMAKEQVMQNIPEAKREAFSKDFDAALPSLYDGIAKIYMEMYTHDDVKQMLKFYESPLGVKMADSMGKITERSTQVGQEWGMKLQEVIMKYME